MSRSKPKVHLLATGGTIANPRDIEGYLSGRQLIEEVPEVEEVADVSVTDVARTGSSGMSPEIWWDLHREITSLAERGSSPDGVVITHGSNTMEETAYFLHLTLGVDIPVVLTAAQRNHRLVGNDGDRNLVDAVKVAAHPEARGRGVLVVVNDEIHGARDVTKEVSSRPDAWSSGNLGVLGLVDKRDNLEFYRTSERRHAPDTEFDIDETSPGDFPQVEVVYSSAGNTGAMIRAAADAGADGIVLAALPTGSPAEPEGHPTQTEAAREARERGIPVVLSHRGFEGWPYPREGFLCGDTLTPQKARILLALGVLQTDDRDELQRLFETY